MASLTGLLMMWLDVVIDPLAVRGDRWFLGRIFYYPEPGWYFGVPVANFVGWVVVGAAITWGWSLIGDRVGGSPPVWAFRLPARPYHALALYYLVLAFNLAVTAAVAEPALFWTGALLHVPLAAVVVCSVRLRAHSGSAPFRAGQPRVSARERTQ
jgi:putative membrane protein